MSASQSAAGSSLPPRPELPKRISAVFEELTATAAKLNAVSDEIAQPISVIDAALRRLNLGVSAWVEVAGEVDHHDTAYFWDRSIGYDKVSRSWGIAIRTRSGSLTDQRVDEETWLFNDAPRSIRLEALDKLPDLLAELVKVAIDTANALKNKLATTKQVAMTIQQVASSTRIPRKQLP